MFLSSNQTEYVTYMFILCIGVAEKCTVHFQKKKQIIFAETVKKNFFYVVFNFYH